MRAILVLALVVAPGLIASLMSPFAALLMYVWYALFRPQDWVYLAAFQQLSLSIVFAGLLIVPALLRGRLPNLSHPLSLLMIAFLVPCVLAHQNAVIPKFSLEWMQFIVQLIFVCLMAITLTNTRARLLALLGVAVGSLGFHAAKGGLVSLMGGGLRFEDGLGGGAYYDNNGYAMATAMIIPLMLAVAQNVEWKWLRRGLYCAAPLCALTIVATYSRGGFVALVSGMGVFVWFQRRRFLALSGIALCLTVFVLLAPLNDSYVARLNTIVTMQNEDGNEETSAASRLHFWKVALAMAEANPWGVGLFNYQANYNQYDFRHADYGFNRSVHSSHFQVLAETGYLGAAVWISLFAYSYWVLFRIRAKVRLKLIPPDSQRFFLTMSTALMASMTAFVFGGATIALALNDLTWMTFGWVVMLDRLAGQTVNVHARAAVPIGAALTSRSPVFVRPLAPAMRRSARP
jgi:putative inorganic carbon (hco3(-)) transporter